MYQEVSFGRLMEEAVTIGANEVVVPDVQWKAQESFELSKSFMQYIDEQGWRKDFKYMVPVWADDAESFMDYFREYMHFDVDVFGIGKWLSTKYNARETMVKWIHEEYGDATPELHLLGNAYPEEIREMWDQVRSMDTSAPVAHAKVGIQYLHGQDTLIKYSEKLTKEVFEADSLKRFVKINDILIQAQVNLAKHNIRMMKMGI